jgi:prophage regulatory protein
MDNRPERYLSKRSAGSATIGDIEPLEEAYSFDPRPSPRFQPSPSLLKRTVRRAELRRIVPLADTTIYELEQRGEFPRRFYLTARCVVWDLAEVEAWVEDRRRASDAELIRRAPSPDVRQRKTRPVRA